jgi:hypothetical protein
MRSSDSGDTQYTVTHVSFSEKLRAFTMDELKSVIKHLNPRKAPGPDLVTTLI